MTERFDIAAYCRISVDTELDRDNTSIENQKSIIQSYAQRVFPGSTLTFYEDRDRSGYTFEQREGYQTMRPLLLQNKYDILIVKDLSRFSRRNGAGLVELEMLRDAGVRIIAIGDNIDYPTNDDWMRIQIYFFMNEMPVTDTSKKVRAVVKRRQETGMWITSVPYGYVITNSKTMTFEVDPVEADVVRLVFEKYNAGWGYKKIANYLTDQGIPTPRMNERARKEAKGEEYKKSTRPEWSIVTIQGILVNDFYIGTLRQGKYTRKKINGADVKKDVSEHIVFENNHEAIVDYRVFAVAQEELKRRTNQNYRGVKGQEEHPYSGFVACGDCGSPMFVMGRHDLKPAYRCGLYHRRGLKGCTSHHIQVDTLDKVVRGYLKLVRLTSSQMIEQLEKDIQNEDETIKSNQSAVENLEAMLIDAQEELKILTRQKTRDIMRKPENAELIEETYDGLIAECEARASGLQKQLLMTSDKRNTVIRVNRIAKAAIGIFDEILAKDTVDKQALDLIVEKIFVFEDHVDVKLKRDVESLLRCGTLAGKTEEAVNFNSGMEDILQFDIVQASEKRRNKVFHANVISNRDPLEIYTEKDGEVIFKKYSPMGELSDFASQICESMHKSTDCPAAVCDRDAVIAASGAGRKELLDRHISPELERIMENRRPFQAEPGAASVPVTDAENGPTATVAVPIITEGDVLGCVVFTARPDGVRATEVELKLASTVAGFLGRQMES